MTKKTETKARSPFFARFLEGQEFPRVKSNVKAGRKHTLKYPSDNEEGGGDV
jgi:hypothetical protein